MSGQNCPGPSKISTDDSRFAETILTWLQAEDNDSDIGSDNEDGEIFSEHESASEQSATSDEELSDNEAEPAQKVYYGKQRCYKWLDQPFVSKNTRTLKHNIILKLPQLKSLAAQLSSSPTPLEVFNLFFDDLLVNEVVLWTNKKLCSMREKYMNRPRDLQDIDDIEMRAFFGLLLYSGLFKSNHEDIRKLFATDGTGRNIFRAVMNVNRFGILLVALRFDNPEDREERKKTDPLAPISKIFNSFIKTCQSLYNPGENLCIDEMLVGYRGRSKFKMYIPNKPDKYGIKIMCMTDARNHYLYNAYIYAGKNSDGDTLSPEESKLAKPTQSVLRLSKPLWHTKRNITADNWFGSIPLATELGRKGLTYVGTLRRNKREIPPELLRTKERTVGYVKYVYTKDLTLLSVVPKKNCVTILLSSMHHRQCTDPDTGKEEIVEYYNMTKGGVDALDEKCKNYGTGRRTQRWSMAIFFRILDIAHVNSYILYGLYKDKKDMQRVDFGLSVALELVKPHMMRRLTIRQVPSLTKDIIREILRIPKGSERRQVYKEKLNPRKTCQTCPKAKKTKTSYQCYLCAIPICLQNCSVPICQNCSGQDIQNNKNDD